MTSLFTARRRAEELAVVLDGPPAAAGGGAPWVDQWMAQPENARLVGVATMVREHPAGTPRPAFTEDLRARLMAEAEVVLAEGNATLALPVRTHGARERRLVAAASAVVLLGGTASMAAAAQDALPGEILYPVKRGIEKVEAGLSLGPAGEGQDLLQQAAVRLREVEGLLVSDAAGSEPRVSQTLDTFAGQADEGARLLFADFAETRDPGSVVTVRSFAADGVSALEDFSGAVPTDAQDELSAAALLLRDIDARAAALCDTCAPELPLLEVPDTFLARAEVDRAMRAATISRLDNSHPFVVSQRGPRTGAGTDDGTGTQGRGGDATSSNSGGASDAPAGGGQDPQPPPGPVAPDAPAPTDAPAPGGVLPPDLPVDGLPDIDANTDAGTPGTGDAPTPPQQPGGGTPDVPSDLDDAVETILPDPEPTLPEVDPPLPEVDPPLPGGDDLLP